MKRIILLGSACLSVAVALGACSSTPEPGDGSGGAASGGKTGSGGRTNTGGKSSGGGSAVSGGGPSTGGAATGGAGPSGGMGGMGGVAMGGMGGAMGGAPSAAEMACAESCAVTTSIGCTGNEDLAACVEQGMSQYNAACDAEFIAWKGCEGDDSASGFKCVEPFPNVWFVDQSSTSACKTEFNDYSDCFNANP